MLGYSPQRCSSHPITGRSGTRILARSMAAFMVYVTMGTVNNLAQIPAGDRQPSA